MKYRRPSTLDEGITSLERLQAFRVTGARVTILAALKRCTELNWFELAMRPLYDANAIVRMLFNSLVPMMQEIVLEEAVLTTLQEQADSAKVKKYETEFLAMWSSFREAAPKRHERQVSERFEKMAGSMQAYAADDTIRQALCILYTHMRKARAALKLIFARITDALLHDVDIVTTTEIPIEALQI